MKKPLTLLFIIVWLGFFSLLIYRTHKLHPERPFFTSWESDLDKCESLCYSSGQNYSRVKLYGMGGCICDNEEGRKMDRGYDRHDMHLL